MKTLYKSQPIAEEKLLQKEQWAYLSTQPSKCLHSFCFDDDDEYYTSAITPDEPVLSTEEPANSLNMGDEHLDTIPAMKSDEFIKSGVENLILIPSESEGIPEHVCDVPSHENSPPLDVSKDQVEDFSESNEKFSSMDDDSFSIDDIDYVEASPPNSELVNSEVMEIVIPEVGGIDDDILLTIEHDVLREKLLNVNLLISKIKALNDNPTPSCDFKTKSSSTSLNSLLEETNNFDNSLPKFTTFSKVPFDAEYESDSSDDQSCSDEDVLEKIVSKPLSEEEIIPMKSHDSSLLISSKIDSLLDEFVGELTILKSIPPGITETDCDFEEDICLIEKLLYDNSSPRPPKEFASTNSDAKIKSFSPSPILDYDSGRDILIPKDLPSNNSLSFAEKESFHFDIPPFSRPSTKPPDGDTRILNIKMMGDISDQKAFMHKLMITHASHQEKSPDLLSHRCETIKEFNTHCNHLNICPMMIHG
nr:hypothetical protein [Tanacetum cinerariifolium]